MRGYLKFRTLTIVLVAILFVACGQDGDVKTDTPATDNPGTPSGPELTISGYLFAAATKDATVSIPEALPTETVSNSISIINATGGITAYRVPAVQQDMWIRIIANVTNNSAAPISVWHTALIEDAIFLTPEYWQCNQCFPYNGGTGCNSVWRVNGGNLTEPQDPPTLPECTGEPPGPFGYCYDTFPAGMDCGSPSWKIDYEPHGTGTWWASDDCCPKEIASDESFLFSHGYRHDAIDVRPNHLAQIILEDATGIINTVTFVFDVEP